VIENNAVNTCSNPVFYSTGPTPSVNDIVGAVTIDYNDFYECGSYGRPTQTHAITGNEMYVSDTSDWHLQAGSPCFAAGAIINYTGYYGEPVNVAFNRDGIRRTSPWDLGAY
jgi:hypothetical protein